MIGEPSVSACLNHEVLPPCKRRLTAVGGLVIGELPASACLNHEGAPLCKRRLTSAGDW